MPGSCRRTSEEPTERRLYSVDRRRLPLADGVGQALHDRTDADLQLIAAAITWAIAEHVTGVGMTAHVTSSVVSLSGGALFANVVSVLILIGETLMLRR